MKRLKDVKENTFSKSEVAEIELEKDYTSVPKALLSSKKSKDAIPLYILIRRSYETFDEESFHLSLKDLRYTLNLKDEISNTMLLNQLQVIINEINRLTSFDIDLIEFFDESQSIYFDVLEY
jgi:hypothetical protein